MATKASLRALVIDNTGRTDKVTTINTALDSAIITFCKVYPFDGLWKEIDIPFVSGVSSCQIPSTFFHVMEARLVDPANQTFSYSMRVMRKREFVREFPNVDGFPVTSRPYKMYVDGSTLHFDCKANSNYVIRVTGYSLDSFLTDTSDIGLKNADEAIVAYATANVYRSVQMYEDAEVWDNRFKQLLQTFINGEEKDVGRDRVAQPWHNTDNNPRGSVIPPWLNPWAGQNIT